MRLLILCALIILTVVPSSASTPVAVWTAGKAEGITLVQHTDGQWGPSDRSDRPAVELLRTAAPPNHYLYFKLAPETRLKLDTEAYLVVDFLDKGVRQIGVQFNAEGNPYQSATGFMLAGTD